MDEHISLRHDIITIISLRHDLKINLCHKLQRPYKKKIYLLKRYFFLIMHNASLQLKFYMLTIL